MKTTSNGLSADEAKKRLDEYGANALVEGKKQGIVSVFFGQFKDLMVIILLIAAAISFASGQKESTIVIVAVLILNAIIGTVQYFKAEKSLESLKALSSPSAKVIRDGVKIEVPSAKIVPGDIIMLEAGDMIVADGRIIENYSLKVNESSLTGESDAVDKSDAVIEKDEVPLGDRTNMVFSGSLVTYGRAVMVVTATGMDTDIGKIAALMNKTGQRKTPLQKSLESFSKVLAIGIIFICVVVFLLSIYRQMSVLEALMFSVALAVAAIPEALSSIVTIVLAIGTQKMAKQNAIIKDLKAVESLGSVSVICSDKTGTLTQNKMTVQKIYADGNVLDGEDLQFANDSQRQLLKISVLVNDATNQDNKQIGDPTEVALVVLAQKLGIDEVLYRDTHPRCGELAFDSDRKMMSTVHEIDGVPTLYTKGALDSILSKATKILTAQGVRDITEQDKTRIEEVNAHFCENGLRVLAFAYRELDAQREVTLADENDFIFVGLISMMDPPREEAIQAVADAKRGGIKTVMITGDYKVTAIAIAKSIGIFEEGDMALSGVELDAMSDNELDEVLPKISVYARVSPENKIRIVSAWQRRGAICSMTGDGVNDAPSLKQADVGVAMGITGTEVSKDAASMILADDNFATIVRAVTNGRNVFKSIRNAIIFLLSGNMAGIFSVLYTSILGLPVPFMAVHLLFINLLTDSLPAIAIGMEPARQNLLNEKPRDPKEHILNKKSIILVLLQGLLIAIATMCAYHIGLNMGGATGASTMAFATLTLARLFHGFNCRGNESIFKLKFTSNKMSLLAFGAGVLLLAAVLFIPGLNTLFMVSDLMLMQIGFIALLAFAPTLIIQLIKIIIYA
ncbi:MAG: cation-translocating P-type ATPase [Oscillospiraceae bacterium]|nr:cation-translocating P-type ATPase [Oscillospiraceae bacterium]